MLYLQGCLKPVRVVIPKGSILDPSENAAVVGGNVLTSQRIVDVIFTGLSKAGESCNTKGQYIRSLRECCCCWRQCSNLSENC